MPATLEKPAPDLQARTRPRNHLATAVTPAPAADDRAELHALEADLDRGQGAWLEVGRALTTIRAGLYRATGLLWPSYLRRRFDLIEARAHQLIDSAVTAAALWPDGDTPAQVREAAVRAMTPVRRELGDDAARAAWARILEQHDGDMWATSRCSGITAPASCCASLPRSAFSAGVARASSSAAFANRNGRAATSAIGRPGLISSTRLSKRIHRG